MIEIIESSSDKVVAVKLSGKLHDEDYKTFVPILDKAIQEHGKLRLLVQFHDFHGWDAHALWDDTKFAATHYTKLERIAMIGESKWEEGMAVVCKPFTTAKVRYFKPEEIADAWKWLEE